MNESNNTYIHFLQMCGWWNDTEISCRNMTAHYIRLPLCLLMNKRYHRPPKKETAHIFCCRTAWCTATDPDFEMKMPAGLPFFLAKVEEETSQHIYLPVSSFEHNSKGSVSNQVFSAVLKVSHSLHCDGTVVQHWWRALNVALPLRQTNPGSNDPQSWRCCFLHCGFISWQAVSRALLHK